MSEDRIKKMLKKSEAILNAGNKRVADDGKTLTCFKCHGAGTYKAPILDDNDEWTDEWESCHCEVCGGTGKITLKAYEWFQSQQRGDNE